MEAIINVSFKIKLTEAGWAEFDGLKEKGFRKEFMAMKTELSKDLIKGIQSAMGANGDLISELVNDGITIGRLYIQSSE